MKEFNYQEYIKDIEERTKHSKAECSEWKGDMYTSYHVTLPNGVVLVFVENNDNTREVYYHYKKEENDKVYKEVALIEHEPGKYHVKVIDQNNLNIKIFGTHLDYDSDKDKTKYEEE